MRLLLYLDLTYDILHISNYLNLIGFWLSVNIKGEKQFFVLCPTFRLIFNLYQGFVLRCFRCLCICLFKTFFKMSVFWWRELHGFSYFVFSFHRVCLSNNVFDHCFFRSSNYHFFSLRSLLWCLNLC